MKNITKSIAACFIALVSPGWTQDLLPLDGGGADLLPAAADQSQPNGVPGKFSVETPEYKTVDSDMPEGVRAAQSSAWQPSPELGGLHGSGPKIELMSLQVTPTAPTATQAVTMQWEMAPPDAQLPVSLVVVKSDAEDKVVEEILSKYWKGIPAEKLEDTLSQELTFWKISAVSATIQKSQSHTFSTGFPEGKYRVFIAAAAPARGTTSQKADFEVKVQAVAAELIVTKPINGEVMSQSVDIGVTTRGLSGGEMVTAKLATAGTPDIVKEFDPAQGLHIDLPDGDYSLVVSRSSQPEEASGAVTFSVKSTPAVQPRITITSPAEGQKLPEGMVPIAWKTIGDTPDEENTAFSISIAKTGTPEATNNKTKNKQHEDQLDSGTYTVSVTRPGYAPANVTFEVEGGNGLLYGALGLLAAGGGALALKKVKSKKRNSDDARGDEDLA